MKLYILASIISLIFAQEAVSTPKADCPATYFRLTAEDNCNWACSDGCADNLCASTGGKCNTEKCVDGWKNGKEGGRCDVPVCEFNGVAGCSEGGECVAPQTCICGQSGAQVVAKPQFDENDKLIGTDCVSLRKDGIMGAGIAIIIMSVSISICGGIAEKNGKAK